MKQNRKYATERINKLRTPATLSDFISILDDLQPGPVVLLARVSKSTQKDNLPDQIKSMVAELERRGFWVIAIIKEIAPGWEDVASGGNARLELERAIALAKVFGVPLVAETVDRFKRSYRYRDKRKPAKTHFPFPPLSVFDMENLKAEADGVQLATLIHPDAGPGNVRSKQTKRGQAGKQRGGGRPKMSKQMRRANKRPLVIEFRNEGKSYRHIARLVKVAWSTVRDWIKAEENRTPKKH